MTSMARSTISLETLLRIEDDPEILKPVCSKTGIPLWVLLRTPFIRTFLYDTLYGQNPPAPFAKIPTSLAAQTTTRSLVHNVLEKRNIKCDILIVATGMGVIKRDGKWFNRLSDRFALQYPDNTTVLEDIFAWRWPYPRQNERVLYQLPTAIGAKAIGRATLGSSLTTAETLVAKITHRARDILDWEPSDSARQILTRNLAQKIASLPWLYKRWTNILKESGATVMLKEEGCYGPSAVAIVAARNLGIITAEYQHGAISRGHDAYNVAPALLASAAYRATLPDYLLGYGQWWIDQINMPVQGISVGNPHRSEVLTQSSDTNGKTHSTILVLGDGVDDEMYLAWSARLASSLGDTFKVIFRPHPSSLANGVVDLLLTEAGSIEIDDCPDLYISLANADIVVSELSTGLFEAVGLVKRIFMWATAKSAFTFPESPFEQFDDIDDLVRQLQSQNSEIQKPMNSELFWASEWKSNYRRFLEHVGALRLEGKDD